MRDVANRAHVSVRTVSRVINGQGEITEATRQRVLATIAEMDYRPSKLARGLVSRHTDTIGLIVGDIANPFFSEIARAMQDKARAAGYDVFFCNSGGSWEEELRALYSLADHGVDGIVISPSPGLTAERIKPFADRFYPIVTVAHIIAHSRISSIVVATRTGARHAVEYLIGKGHTCIGMLAGPAPSPLLQSRVQGYRDALSASEIVFRSELVLSGTPTFERGHILARDLLIRCRDITAIFAYNDLLALGAMRACRELGRRIPGDCAIIGFDDIPPADWISPTLTTVRVDKHALGAQAMARLLEMLDEPEVQYAPVFIPAELVVRESA
jgi:LacI family transcriptional regulator